MLTREGWTLAPAYDMNPDPDGEGLKLNISESDNAQDLELAREVAPYFRLSHARSKAIIDEITSAVRTWREVASDRGLAGSAQERVRRAFRAAER